MTSLTAVTFDARDPARLASFWGALLGREPVGHAGGVLLPGTRTQLGVRFVEGAAVVRGARRMHPHLTSDTVDDKERLVATALSGGARHLDVGQLPEEGHVVLADPEGNELCVIEAGNGFLAGCGLWGELACDGTREVGVFWSRALAWPLVWDEDGETAVQSPHGGTKVAWGGPPVEAMAPRNAQRLDLAVPGAEHAAEVERLLGLGATFLADEVDGAVELADPDGNELVLRPA